METLQPELDIKPGYEEAEDDGVYDDDFDFEDGNLYELDEDDNHYESDDDPNNHEPGEAYNNYEHNGAHNGYELDEDDNHYESYDDPNNHESGEAYNNYEHSGAHNGYELSEADNNYEHHGAHNGYESGEADNNYEHDGAHNGYEPDEARNSYELDEDHNECLSALVPFWRREYPEHGGRRHGRETPGPSPLRHVWNAFPPDIAPTTDGDSITTSVVPPVTRVPSNSSNKTVAPITTSVVPPVTRVPSNTSDKTVAPIAQVSASTTLASLPDTTAIEHYSSISSNNGDDYEDEEEEVSGWDVLIALGALQLPLLGHFFGVPLAVGFLVSYVAGVYGE
jgi:hypothetical protein